QRWYEYTGTTLEEMRGRGWELVVHPDYLDRAVQKARESVRDGTIWDETFPVRGKDGTYRWFLSRAAPIRDAAGRVVRWFGTSTDITEVKLLEEALKETDRRKDEFLAMLAHELRNPLAPIRNEAEVLKLIGPADPDHQKARDVIERQAQQMG